MSVGVRGQRARLQMNRASLESMEKHRLLEQRGVLEIFYCFILYIRTLSLREKNILLKAPS